MKIDRSFVVDATETEEGASLVRAIIAMGQGLGLTLVAEGVETLEQYDFMTSSGTTLIQGYLFSPPVPADELEPMLSPWHFHERLQGLEGQLER